MKIDDTNGAQNIYLSFKNLFPNEFKENPRKLTKNYTRNECMISFSKMLLCTEVTMSKYIQTWRLFGSEGGMNVLVEDSRAKM